MDSLPLRRVLGDEVAAVYRDLHAAHGVDFRFERGRLARSRARTAGSRGVRARRRDGAAAADLVVVGVGIRPTVELAEAAGLQVDNGVVTDALLRTSDPQRLRLRRCRVRFNPLLGSRLRVEHWANALNGGPAAARSMLGRHRASTRRCRTSSPTSTTSGMEYAGWVAPGAYDRVVFRGAAEVAGRGGAGVRGVLGRGRPGARRDERQRLGRHGDHPGPGPGRRPGATVDLDALADAAVPLADLVPRD